jgi:hypothetical protein
LDDRLLSGQPGVRQTRAELVDHRAPGGIVADAIEQLERPLPLRTAASCKTIIASQRLGHTES